MSTATYIDTHCHLQDRALIDDIDNVVARARGAGVAALVDCGYDAASNAGVLALAERFDVVHPAVGFHPHDAKNVSGEMLREIESQAKAPAVVAIGEIGLDFYRDHSPRDVQRRMLQRQLEIAVSLGLPVSVHSRGAEHVIHELLDPFAAASPLRAEGRPVGVMHCFGGTLEQARYFVDEGFMVSIACVITYPNSHDVRKLAAALPLESLVVETDSPYLPPQTMRGKRNEPSMVGAAVAGVAAARRMSVAEVAVATTANAARLFGLHIASGMPEAVSR